MEVWAEVIRVFFFNRKESVIHPGRELISFPLRPYLHQ